MSGADEVLLLRPEGVRLVTPELADGRRPSWERSVWEDLAERPARRVAMRPLVEAVEEVMGRFRAFDTAMDGPMAEAVHRALRLSRREAADQRLWRFLAVAALPAVVRHRWAHHSFATMRPRFIRPGTRPDSNAFSRWWWIAELTHADGDYALTHRVFAQSALTNAVFIRSLSFYRPAVEACVAVLADQPGELIERVMFELSRWLALVPLEGLPRDALEATLTRLVERCSR